MKNKFMLLASVFIIVIFTMLSVVTAAAYGSGITNTGDNSTTIMIAMGVLMVVAVITIIFLSRKK